MALADNEPYIVIQGNEIVDSYIPTKNRTDRIKPKDKTIQEKLSELTGFETNKIDIQVVARGKSGKFDYFEFIYDEKIYYKYENNCLIEMKVGNS